MRFLSVAERELRAAARRKGTYVVRWATAAAFFLLLLWMMWAFGALKYQGRAHEVFTAYSVVVFFYCLIVGAAQTADCLSSERREGTLGFLFLTNLNSFEIIAGKLCSSALSTVYALLAIFPMLALPLLMGGTTLDQFWRTMLALLNAIFFSLAAGFVASVLCRRQFIAVALAMTLALVFGAGLLGGAAIIAEFTKFRGPRLWVVDGLSTVCPLYTLAAAQGGRLFGRNHYWSSLACVAGFSLSWLGFVTWQLARSWRDRPKSFRATGRFNFAQVFRQRSSGARAALRRRLLNINPFYWLAGRGTVSSPVFMLIVLVLVLITVYGTAPYFARIIPAGDSAPVAGSMVAWLCAGLAIHALALYYAAMIASQRLAEDKQTGALELVLSTPATEHVISRGLWMAFVRRMFFPALIAVLVHVYFLWQVMVMALLEPPGKIPPHTTSAELFWAAVLDQPLGGQLIEWEFGFLLRVALLSLVLLALMWFTLGWVGRWLGLRMKHPGFAPMVALALLVVPPVLFFSLLCYLGDQIHFLDMRERQLFPLMLWVAFGIGVAHCLLLCGWAARRLREDFRATVIGRFETARRWCLPRGHTVLRFALRTAAFAGALALLITGFYGCQNYRNRRAWTAFQTGLKQRGESLDVTAVLPPPVADNVNFARSAAFRDLVAGKNAPFNTLLNHLSRADLIPGYSAQSQDTFAWSSQRHAPFPTFATWIDPDHVTGSTTNSAELAGAVLKQLQPHAKPLAALATAARLPAIQLSTNRDARALLQPSTHELQLLERLHFLFTLRSLAQLETGHDADATEDLLTSLRLVGFARQLPDTRSTPREQLLLMRSFQPLWEGLSRHQWNEPELTAIQAELAPFDLLSDYTNAVRRIVLAHIDVWKKIPEGHGGNTVPAWGGGYMSNSDWRSQPRAWWFWNCIQLHQLGQDLIEQVDVAGGCIKITPDWSSLSDLPLEQETRELLGQNFWQQHPSLVAFAQTSLNQARTACALERHRLAQGNHPKTLDDLIPAYLDRAPKDALNNRPLVFQPLPEGSYILRSLGPNHIDDRTNSVSDDWLWAYSTNAPAAAAPGSQLSPASAR